MELVQIDGSYGEGGGQILRTALSFSIIQGRPIHVFKIRSGRDVPGLRPQHAAVLRILRDVSGGTLEGGHVGSTEVSFSPGRVESTSLKIDLGTAASITLVLQALVPAVSLSGASLDVEFTGGTDVPWSPTSDYFAMVIAPVLKLIGINLDFQIRRRGYYPNGGGLVRALIHPSVAVKNLDLSRRTTLPRVTLYSRCGRLPRHVAERQASAATSRLRASGIDPVSVFVSTEQSSSPGSSILISAMGETCFVGSDAIGARGRPAEQVGEHAASEFARVYNSGSTVDSHLADMLAPLLCLASGESNLLIPNATEHLRTSLHVANIFTGSESSFSARDGTFLLSIKPAK